MSLKTYRQVEFANKKIVSLASLFQFNTYQNLLCGLPTTPFNASICNRLKDEVKEFFDVDAFYLIPPLEIEIPINGTYKLGTPMQLPSITCIAEFFCFESCTRLILAWYQNDFALPIDEEILQKIKLIVWEETANEFDI